MGRFQIWGEVVFILEKSLAYALWIGGVLSLREAVLPLGIGVPTRRGGVGDSGGITSWCQWGGGGRPHNISLWVCEFFLRLKVEKKYKQGLFKITLLCQWGGGGGLTKSHFFPIGPVLVIWKFCSSSQILKTLEPSSEGLANIVGKRSSLLHYCG